MANVDVSGFAQFSDGTSVPLFNDAMPEGTLTTLQTNATFTVAAQDLGNYSPGKTLVSLYAYAENNAAYVFVLRQGLPIFFGSAGKSGVMSYGNKMFPKSVVLQPGDTVQCLALSATDRTCTFIAHCTDGTQRAFVTATAPSGAATTNLTDSITGNSIGDTLQGKQISMAMALSIDGTKITSGGVVILNAKGSVVGVLGVGSPIESQVCFSPFNTRIGLNFVAQIVTDA
jgi:hypothetical protein